MFKQLRWTFCQEVSVHGYFHTCVWVVSWCATSSLPG